MCAMRKRWGPNKRWSDDEVASLLAYLKEHRDDLDSITQSFFKRFLVEYPMSVDWATVRHKLRNLKTGYFKTKQWIAQNNGIELDKDKLMRMCPHFDELEYIFYGVSPLKNGQKSSDSSSEEESESKKLKTIPAHSDSSLKAQQFAISEKRKKIEPIKKWTIEENLQILNYIHQNGNFEKPTAQIYYTKILTETKIEATWLLLKCKMNIFKQSFMKANTWRRSREAGMLEDETGIEYVKERVQEICPYYERLLEIFGDLSDDTPTSSQEQSDLNHDDSENTLDEESDILLEITKDPLYSIKMEPEEEEVEEDETIDDPPSSPQMRSTRHQQKKVSNTD